MSKLDEVREALRQRNDIIATEQVTTVVPYQTSDNGTGKSWTQVVHFSLIPKFSRGRDGDLWRFQQLIVEALPVSVHSEGPIKGWSYGTAHCRENIGTMIERKSRLIMIEDPAIPLTDDFNSLSRTWDQNFEPIVTNLYRLITFGFFPMEHLYMMVTGVENAKRNESWLHEPSERNLQDMNARLARNRRR